MRIDVGRLIIEADSAGRITSVAPRRRPDRALPRRRRDRCLPARRRRRQLDGAVGRDRRRRDRPAPAQRRAGAHGAAQLQHGLDDQAADREHRLRGGPAGPDLADRPTGCGTPGERSGGGITAVLGGRSRWTVRARCSPPGWRPGRSTGSPTRHSSSVRCGWPRASATSPSCAGSCSPPPARWWSGPAATCWSNGPRTRSGRRCCCPPTPTPHWSPRPASTSTWSRMPSTPVVRCSLSSPGGTASSCGRPTATSASTCAGCDRWPNSSRGGRPTCWPARGHRPGSSLWRPCPMPSCCRLPWEPATWTTSIRRRTPSIG